MTPFRLGIVGDLHTHWDEIDVSQLNQCNYDLLYFTGDLGGGTPESTLRVARELSKLRTATLVMPGNNDTFDIAELAAELTYRSGLSRLAQMRQTDSPDDPPTTNLKLCGYSLHPLSGTASDMTLIAARPHSLGGNLLSYPEFMTASYGISSLEHSIERLCGLVDQVETSQIMFISHNGPTGLGDKPHDMWGCDFKPDGGDWGDPDLRAAIEYAGQTGKRVTGVIAGHMHLKTKHGALRDWHKQRNGVVYINAARVPRIYAAEDDVVRHHIAITVNGEELKAEEILLPQYAG